MKLGQEFYPLKSLRSNQKYGVFLKKPRNLGQFARIFTPHSNGHLSPVHEGYTCFAAKKDCPVTVMCIPCPSSDRLIKFKSLIYEDSFKLRELATHRKHPWRPLSRRMGRALTLFWKRCVVQLNSHELITMSDIVHWTCKHESSFNNKGIFLEFDLCEMFMSIPRNKILPALDWLFKRVFLAH